MLNRLKLKGLSHVFRFTLLQLLKKKGNIIGLVVFFLIIVVMGPGMALLTGNMMNGDGASVEHQSYLERREEALQRRQERLLEAGLSEEQLALLSQDLYAVGSNWEEYKTGVPEAEKITSPDEVTDDDFDTDDFSQNLGSSMLMMMLCILSVSFVVRSVVEEKTSKLVDLLMVSIEPLALLMGKILATLVYTLFYFLVQLLGFFVSDLIMKHLMNLEEGLGEFITIRLADTSPLGILIFLITCILGLLAFALLSGLSAAGCSSIEETSSAMSTAMLLCFAGYYFSMFVFAFNSKALVIVCSLLPFISMFIMPNAVLVYDFGYWLIPLSWGVQILFVAVAALLSAKVYQALIVHKGKRIGLPQILRMAFGKEVA